MTPEQEKLLVKIAENLEKGLDKFVIAAKPEMKWHHPKAVLLRLIRFGAGIVPPEFQFIAGCLHGCVDLFGISGTVKLAIHTRRKLKNATGTSKKA